jgi:hypothetical protein
MQEKKELLIDKSERRAATNRRSAQWRVTWSIELLPCINFCGFLTVFCSEIRHFAKLRTVIQHLTTNE